MQERQGRRLEVLHEVDGPSFPNSFTAIRPSASQLPVACACVSPMMSAFGQQWGFHPTCVPHATCSNHSMCDEADFKPTVRGSEIL